MRRFLLVLVVVLLAAGCATFEQAVSDITTGIADLAEASEEGMRLAPALEFSLVYASYGLLGGLELGGGEFGVGTGVTYDVRDTTGDGAEVTQAKLAPGGAGGFWWALEVQSDGDRVYYEFLVDRDDTILKVRYRNRDTGEVEEFIPDPTEDEDYDDEAPSYRDYIVGKERITTPAGTFNTDKVFFGDDPDYTLTYWVTPSVPGGTVRYVADNIAEGETVTAELIAIEKGFSTTLDSY